MNKINLLLCQSNGCEVKVTHGILLANGFHLILNFNGSPLFHIARTPVTFRDLKSCWTLFTDRGIKILSGDS